MAEILPDSNENVLTKYDHLYKNKLYINSDQQTENQHIKPNNTYKVNVIYRHYLRPCKLNILDNSGVEVSLLKPEAMN